MAGLSDAVREVSKGVSEKTSQEYSRYVQHSGHEHYLISLSLMKQWQAFLVGRRMISEGSQFFCNNPHSQAAIYIVAWIMDS